MRLHQPAMTGLVEWFQLDRLFCPGGRLAGLAELQGGLGEDVECATATS